VRCPPARVDAIPTKEEGIEDRVITRDLVPWHLVYVLTLLHDVGVVTVFGDQLQLVVVVVVLQVVAHGVVLVDAGVAVERDEVRPLKLVASASPKSS